MSNHHQHANVVDEVLPAVVGEARITALATDDLDISDLFAHAGAGLENVKKEDLQTNFLSILQSNSPQVDASDPKYIKGALAGEIISSVSSQRCNSLLVIPVAFYREVVEWKGNRGGLVKRHPADYDIESKLVGKNAEGKPVTVDGNELVETRYHDVLIVTEDGLIPATIPMKSTQIKKSKRWCTVLDNTKRKNSSGVEFTLPSYAQIFKLTTVAERNQKGPFKNWQIESAGFVTSKAMLQAGAKHAEFVAKRGVPIEVAPKDESEGATAGDDNVPF